MQAYEFYATSENGVIKIPKAFTSRKQFKVIVLDEEPAIKNKWESIFPPTINTIDWKFNRDEANERR